MKPNRHIDIMGIVNLTDDSYFAASRCPSPDMALKRIEKMLADGADIIDIGACSSRPGSTPVGPDEEWRRLEPVLKALAATFPDVRVSIDTYWASVVEKTYGLIGDFIVNDISAGEDDPLMLPVAGRLGLEYVAMHKRGTSVDMQSMTCYDDVVAEVIRYFNDFAIKAQECGVRKWILDPGFGFAKTIDQNYTLLSKLSHLKTEYSGHSPRVLVGLSRKSMIYRLLDITPEQALPATQALHMAALINGADILRVHDVKDASQVLKMFAKL